MFAIEITEDNMSKIREVEVSSEYDTSCTKLLAQPKRWYLVRGYVTHEGKLFNWTILPAYIIEKFFEHDPDKIKSNWDQIVRK